VPVVTFADLEAGKLVPAVLGDRLLVVGPEQDDPRSDAHAASLAAALSATLAGGGRAPTPWWVSLLVVLGLGAAGWLGHRRGGSRWAFIASLAGLPILFGLQLAGVLGLRASLLPLASLLGAGAAAAVVVSLPLLARAWAGMGRTRELIDRAGRIGVRAEDDLAPGPFFQRVARLAEQCHPADLVLVAELCPRQWHLRFWQNDRVDDRVVRERRRDVRRTPYCDEDGVHRIHVVRGFLVMKDVPVVVVPLQAVGELEGYVFFCGEQAEASHRADPAATERLARELGLVLRHRRLALAGEGAPAAEPPRARRDAIAPAPLARTAQVVLGDMELFASILRNSPVEVLYADSFGEIRLLGGGVEATLGELGITVPAESSTPLPAGSLTLARVLVAATGRSPQQIASSMAQLLEGRDGICLEVPARESIQPLSLSVRPIRRLDRGIDYLAGYVATFMARGVEAPASNVVSLAGADPIQSFSLSEAVVDVAQQVTRTARRPVRVAASRGAAYALARRGSLLRALERFLGEAVRASSGDPPVVRVRERRGRAEIQLLDLQLGVPIAVVERVLQAPDLPPKGLEGLGRLAQVIEDCHGRIKVRGGRGLGLVLVIGLPRARPVISKSDAVGLASEQPLASDLPLASGFPALSEYPPDDGEES
jgi:hypothetical protein